MEEELWLSGINNLHFNVLRLDLWGKIITPFFFILQVLVEALYLGWVFGQIDVTEGSRDFWFSLDHLSENIITILLGQGAKELLDEL